MDLNLAFVGFGNVAQAFAKLLNRREAALSQQYDLRCRATGIATAHHGCITSDSGIDLAEAIKYSRQNRSLNELSGTSRIKSATELVETCQADILFETAPLNPFDGEPAATYIRSALERGINVVTANKGPVAFAYRELAAVAKASRAAFRFEGTVMDGIPIFNLVEYCLPATQVVGFYGVLNSTTNLILTAMEEGSSFADGLAEAQRLGIAEANADFDIDGWDSALKAVALANVLMDSTILPPGVKREGIRGINPADLRRAKETGAALRLVSRAAPSPDSIEISVAPELLPLDTPLANLRGSSNGLVLETDLMGSITILEQDPGVEQTAFALFSDMIGIAAKGR